VSLGRTTVLFVGIGAGALAPAAIAVVTGGLIDAVSLAGGDREATSTTQVIALASMLCLLVLIEGTSGPIVRAAATTLGRDVDLLLQERVMRAVGRPVLVGHLEIDSVLDDIRAVRGLGLDAQRPSQAVEALPTIMPDWVRMVGAAIVLSTYKWWLGLLWLVVWPIVIGRLDADYVRVGETRLGKSGELRRLEYLRDLMLDGDAAKEVRLWRMRDWTADRFDRLWERLIGPIIASRRARAGVVLGSSGLFMFATGLSYALLAWSAVQGNLALGSLGMLVYAMSSVSTFETDDSYAHLAFAAVSVPKVLALDRRIPNTTEIATSGQGRSYRAMAGNIEFKDVSFQYPNARQPVFQSFNLSVEEGQSIAIVGNNGAGKTTFVKLLCGLYEPDQGTISVGEQSLTDINRRVWQSNVAVLFQDFGRYHLSVRENIALGLPDEEQDIDDMLRSAARRAGILDVIENLPNKWDTVLTRDFEGGVDLSGGQWQRIGLARALLAADLGARILVLDEPTAALDVRGEADIYARFLELTSGLTTCIISHRFSTVRQADRIVVLDGGRIVEDGSHDDLIAACGRYASMFELQSQRFRESSC
jgi:ATP-binding cassette subfamily B protein